MISTLSDKETIPKDWNCTIFKKWDPAKTINYRQISLLDSCYKVLSSLLLERINPYVSDFQCGFRKDKLTVDHIFALMQIIVKHYKFDIDLHLIFIDYKQAYGSIDREEL